MEAERAIYYAQNGYLSFARPSGSSPDFDITGFYPGIQHVEVKWKNVDGLLDIRARQRLQRAIDAVPSGTLLVEYNNIGTLLEGDLVAMGGRRFSGTYP